VEYNLGPVTARWRPRKRRLPRLPPVGLPVSHTLADDLEASLRPANSTSSADQDNDPLVDAVPWGTAYAEMKLLGRFDDGEVAEVAAKVFGDIGDSSYTEIHRTEHIVLMSKAAGPKLNQTVLKVYLSIPEVSLDDIVWIKGDPQQCLRRQTPDKSAKTKYLGPAKPGNGHTYVTDLKSPTSFISNRQILFVEHCIEDDNFFVILNKSVPSHPRLWSGVPKGTVRAWNKGSCEIYTRAKCGTGINVVLIIDVDHNPNGPPPPQKIMEMISKQAPVSFRAGLITAAKRCPADKSH